jgi:hypothetical protein
MHIGTGSAPSNTEAAYSSPPRRLNSDADSARLRVLDYLSNRVGFIDFTTEFKDLGSFVHHSLPSNADINKRIRAASAAFGALENILTNKAIDLRFKGRVYEALSFSILLHGREIWC